MTVTVKQLKAPIDFDRVSMSYSQESLNVLKAVGSGVIPEGSTFIQVSLFGGAITEWIRKNIDKVILTDQVCSNPMALGKTFQQDCTWVAQWTDDVLLATAAVNSSSPDYFLVIPNTHKCGNVDDLKKAYIDIDKVFLEFLDGIIGHWPIWDMKPADEGAFSKIFLPAQLKSEIIADFDEFLHARHEYRELGLPWRRGYMFIGPPGNGKTKMIRSMCDYWGLDAQDLSSRIDQTGNLHMDGPMDGLLKATRQKHIAFDIDDLENDGDELKKSAGLIKLPENLIRRMLDVIERGSRPNIFFLEDIDKFVAFQAEGEHKDAGEMSLHALLKGLDGVEQKSDSVIIATTNFADQLAEALINRPGRFDRIWDFPKPGPDRIVQLFQSFGLKIMKDGKTLHKHMNNIADALADSGANMAFAEELVKSVLSKYKRKEVSPKEVDEITERIKAHLEFCAKRFGKNNEMGFGANLTK